MRDPIRYPFEMSLQHLRNMIDITKGDTLKDLVDSLPLPSSSSELIFAHYEHNLIATLEEFFTAQYRDALRSEIATFSQSGIYALESFASARLNQIRKQLVPSKSSSSSKPISPPKEEYVLELKAKYTDSPAIFVSQMVVPLFIGEANILDLIESFPSKYIEEKYLVPGKSIEILSTRNMVRFIRPPKRVAYLDSYIAQEIFRVKQAPRGFQKCTDYVLKIGREETPYDFFSNFSVVEESLLHSTLESLKNLTSIEKIEYYPNTVDASSDTNLRCLSTFDPTQIRLLNEQGKAAEGELISLLNASRLEGRLVRPDLYRKYQKQLYVGVVVKHRFKGIPMETQIMTPLWFSWYNGIIGHNTQFYEQREMSRNEHMKSRMEGNYLCPCDNVGKFLDHFFYQFAPENKIIRL